MRSRTIGIHIDLKKRLAKMGIDPVTQKPKINALGSSSCNNPKDAANLSHMAQWDSARLEAEARLVKDSKLVSNPVLQNQVANSSASQLTNKAVAWPASISTRRAQGVARCSHRIIQFKQY